jgi:hypothetical protein
MPNYYIKNLPDGKSQFAIKTQHELIIYTFDSKVYNHRFLNVDYADNRHPYFEGIETDMIQTDARLEKECVSRIQEYTQKIEVAAEVAVKSFNLKQRQLRAQ